jgi:hypothetical protein
MGGRGAVALAVTLSALPAGAQKLEDLATPRPLAAGDLLVIGFQGGWKRHDDATLGPRMVDLWLAERGLPHLHAETFANRRRAVALELVREAMDLDRDGLLEPAERDDGVRLVILGMSLGGSAVIKLAWELRALDLPILLTIQVESVGYGDEEIPPNVALAANFYQYSGFLPRGEQRIRPVDPASTVILGNFGYDYRGPRREALERVGQPWWSRLLRNHHRAVDRDPSIWREVERLVLGASVLRAVPYSELRQYASAFPVPDSDRR